MVEGFRGFRVGVRRDVQARGVGFSQDVAGGLQGV